MGESKCSRCKTFYHFYSNRLRDQYIQNWNNYCNTCSKLIYYRHFKTSYTVEPYLTIIGLNKFRRCFAAFRASSHCLMIEKGRHFKLDRANRFCPYCNDTVECEYHFLLICPLYNELRARYIQKKYYNRPNLNKFYILMASNRKVVIRNLSMFIYYAFKKRSFELNSLSN